MANKQSRTKADFQDNMSSLIFRFEAGEKMNWPPMLGYMDKGIVWRAPPQDMNQTYLSNPKAYYCPNYFYDGSDPYPDNYMHGAGYFLPWWSLPCIYQQNFQVIIQKSNINLLIGITDSLKLQKAAVILRRYLKNIFFDKSVLQSMNC